jgi:hypothetical protein
MRLHHPSHWHSRFTQGSAACLRFANDGVIIVRLGTAVPAPRATWTPIPSVLPLTGRALNDHQLRQRSSYRKADEAEMAALWQPTAPGLAQ